MPSKYRHRYRLPEKIPEWLLLAKKGYAVNSRDVGSLFNVRVQGLNNYIDRGQIPKPDFKAPRPLSPGFIAANFWKAETIIKFIRDKQNGR